MYISFNTPDFINEAKSNGRGHNILIETLIFIAVFIISSVAEAIPAIVYYVIRIFSSSDLISMAGSGNVTGMMELLNSGDVSTIVSLLSTVIDIITVIIFCRFIEKRSLRTMGFVKKDFIKEYAVGILTGAALFSTATFICAATGALTFNGFYPNAAAILVLFFMGYMVQGMSEEVLCRGYFMVSVSRKSSLGAAVISNALVFACLHLLNPGISILAFVNLFMFGVFVSVYMLRRGNIWGAAALHSAWNFVQGNIFGISVSGGRSHSSLLSSAMSPSASLINGGAFGLEGGLAVTIVLAAGIAAVMFIPKRQCTK